ncbi:TM2 domain-containing protein [Mycobacterium shigaense]|uniref:TM2 domain-containing protein n=1 Tax=Mycobacterium shigaense TaxID=722731 RepID=A0A1Z4EH05_9MYCO|nr:TM2 domain-containing protein [Mycobacterium shigaense]MEA1122947.1 TM2 domain-containing protein [Mycobacterium shigaense]BAX92241.1 hypothetical protein MSG_02092 [Mycobacterium shigaense]
MTSQTPAPGRYPDPNGGPGNVTPYGGAAQGIGPSGQPLSDKSKMVAGLLQIFLGGLGIGRFYLGYTTIGILQIVVTVFTFGIGGLWPFVDGIMILLGKVPDAQGHSLRD